MFYSPSWFAFHDSFMDPTINLLIVKKWVILFYEMLRGFYSYSYISGVYGMQIELNEWTLPRFLWHFIFPQNLVLDLKTV